MDGPFLAFKLLVLISVFGWFYRRFERVHGRFPAFERFLRRRPLLVAVQADDPHRVAAAIRRSLGPGSITLAGTGLRPWPFYAVSVDVEVDRELVLVRAKTAALLRVDGKDPPSLIATLRDALPADAEAWVHPALWVDLVGGARPDSGWRVRPGEEELEPHVAAPSWLPSEPESVPLG